MAEDRRIRKTQNAIINATVELLGTTPINQLTIKEICAKADVSRSTFYLHYYDASDVIEQVYNEIAASASNVLDQFDFTNLLSNPKPFLELVADFVAENHALYELLLQNNYHSDFRRRLKTLLERKVLEENTYRFRNRREFEYQVCFLMSGLVETVCDNMSDMATENRSVLLSTIANQISSGFKAD